MSCIRSVSVIRFILLLSLASAVVSAADSAKTKALTARMPMHKTDGIFDLISPMTLMKFASKVLQAPLMALGRVSSFLLLSSTSFLNGIPLSTQSNLTICFIQAVLPLLELPYHILATLWSWVGPGTTVPGMTALGARGLSTGVLTGVASRVLDIDVIDLILNVSSRRMSNFFSL